jgi:hypothetical protein
MPPKRRQPDSEDESYSDSEAKPKPAPKKRAPAKKGAPRSRQSERSGDRRSQRIRPLPRSRDHHLTRAGDDDKPKKPAAPRVKVPKLTETKTLDSGWVLRPPSLIYK